MVEFDLALSQCTAMCQGIQFHFRDPPIPIIDPVWCGEAILPFERVCKLVRADDVRDKNADYLPRLLCVESWLLSIIGIYVYDDDVSSKYGFNLLCSKLTFESTWKLISFIVFTPVLKTSGKKQGKPIPLVTWYSHVPLMNHPPKLRLCLQKHAWCKKWRKRISASVDWCSEYLRSEKLTCN